MNINYFFLFNLIQELCTYVCEFRLRSIRMTPMPFLDISNLYNFYKKLLMFFLNDKHKFLKHNNVECPLTN